MKETVSEGAHRLAASLLGEGVDIGQTFRVFVVGSSMGPLFRIGDRVQARRVMPDTLQPGEVVVVAAPKGDLVIHRCLECDDKDEGMLLTKGDRSLVPDPPWSLAQLLGRVETIERKNRRLDIYKGRGRHSQCLMGAVALWEWRMAARFSSRLVHRFLRRGGGALKSCLAALAWLTR